MTSKRDNDKAGYMHVFGSRSVLREVFNELDGDDGWRVAYALCGAAVPVERRRDNRKWAMVDEGAGRGAKPMIIDGVVPEKDFTIENNFPPEKYQRLGLVNIYADILGYVSEKNSISQKPIEGAALEQAVGEWYLRSTRDNDDVIEEKKADFKNLLIRSCPPRRFE